MFPLFEQGGHGFGMYPKATTGTGWFDEFARCMTMYGWMKPAAWSGGRDHGGRNGTGRDETRHDRTRRARRADDPGGGRGSVGYAVAGLGRLSLGQILPALKRTRGAHLAALVSGTPDEARRVAAEYGLPASAIYSYDTFDGIARNPDVQVVYIVLPNSLHADFTVRAFKAGKHVLCEKPMAVTIAECERMIAAGKVANRKLMIAYRCQFEPVNVTAMQVMREGTLGVPRPSTT